MVGVHLTSSGFHPFRWERGQVTDLGVLEKGPYEFGKAMDINNRGQVTGFSVVDQDPEQSGTHAFLWQDGMMTDLGTLGTDALAFAINDRGQIVGTSYPVSGGAHAFVWQDGVMTDLGAGTAIDINNRGQIIGTHRDADGSITGALWEVGRVADLVTPVAIPGIEPVAINDHGWVVGQRLVGIHTRSFLWRAGSLVDLGTLGGSQTTAVDINNRGQIVGVSEQAGQLGPHPFLWRDGVMSDLTGHGLGEYSTPLGIDIRGQIAGTASDPDGDWYAALYR